MKLTSANIHASHSSEQSRQVHTITDRFSMVNTYLLADDQGLIVVDPGSTLQTQLLHYYVRHFLHRNPGDIDLIVLTHLYRDQSAGIKALQRSSRIPVAALIRPPAQSQQNGARREFRRYYPTALPSIYERQAKLVDVWLEDVAGLPSHPHWRVIAWPGRMPGSLLLYNPFSFELLCGDAMANREGRAVVLRGSASRLQLEEILHLLRTLRVHYFYPGYGRPLLSLHSLHDVTME